MTPSLATTYKVELFKNSTAAKPLAISPATTVYVTVDAITGSAHKCRRPVCHEKFHVRVLVPPSALATEIAQRWHPYFGLRHAAAQQPSTPQLLVLSAGRAQLSKPRRISGGEFGWTIAFSFPAGKRAYAWNWTACTKTNQATDGIGLPSQNGCGSQRIHAPAPGMLPSPCTRYLACAAPAPASNQHRYQIRHPHRRQRRRPTLPRPRPSPSKSKLTSSITTSTITTSSITTSSITTSSTSPPAVSSFKDLGSFLGLLVGSVSLAVLRRLGLGGSGGREPAAGGDGKASE